MQLKAVLLSYTDTKINHEQTSFSVRTTLTAISNCFPLFAPHLRIWPYLFFHTIYHLLRVCVTYLFIKFESPALHHVKMEAPQR